MKNDKKGCLGEAVAEIVIELVLTVALCGIGLLVFKLFGLNFDDEAMDPDLLVLAGIGAIVAAALIFWAVWYIFRHFKSGNGCNKKNKK